MPKPLVLVVLGTRPEAVKLARLVRLLRRRSDLDCEVAVTGQHGAVLDRALRELGLAMEHRLGPRGSPSLARFAADRRRRLGALIGRLRPALVVVQGDTTSALCGALAARARGVPVAHVEAGVRSGDPRSPYPEERNRVEIDRLSSLLLAPTRRAARNLARCAGRVVVTGNTGIDALRWALARRRPARNRALAAALRRPGRMILATLHRRESWSSGLRGACAGIARILDARPDAFAVFPLHANPRVAKLVAVSLRHPRALLLPPLGYFDTIAALRACRLLMTDSGGLQEEAAALGKPTLVLRQLTDRPEAVAAGVAVVAGLKPRRIAELGLEVLGDSKVYRRMSRPTSAFGDGRAAARAAAAISREATEAPRRSRRPRRSRG